MVKKQKASLLKNKISLVIFLSFILYVIISLFDSSRDIALWEKVFTNTIFITGTILSFVIMVGIMSFFLWCSCQINKIPLSSQIYLIVVSPSIVLAAGAQKLIFYIFFNFSDGDGRLFLTLPSVIIPAIIAGLIYLFSTTLILRWYSGIKLNQCLKVGIFSTLIPLVLLILKYVYLASIMGL